VPELPEAEICRRQLQRWTRGRTIRDVERTDPAVFRTHLSTRPSDADHDANVHALVGLQVDNAVRHGKRIGLRIGPWGLLLHLGMNGRWLRNPNPEPRTIRLRLDLGDMLVFDDRRRFGCVVMIPGDQLEVSLSLGHGPDALLAPLDGASLQKRLTGRRAIKVALLDQSVLAGLGNIHAAEALWRARIHPTTPSNQVEANQAVALAVAISEQLNEAISAQDGDEMVYVTDRKDAENPFSVYARADQPCHRCATPIAKISQSGRSTFFCPACQEP
jgi:formamidopyrimidine-DNA glycosylase